MTRIHLKSGFPKLCGDLAFQNHWLRLGGMLALVVATLSLCIAATVLRRKPLLIALDQKAQIIPLGETPSIEAEVDQAAREYVHLRYTWSAENLASRLNRVRSFVAPQSLKAFAKTAAELQAFSKGKTIGQRVYPTDVQVNSPANRVQILGDRFTEIQGLKAATLLRVTLTYQTGPRTLENPWGVYVVQEEEVQ